MSVSWSNYAPAKSYRKKDFLKQMNNMGNYLIGVSIYYLLDALYSFSIGALKWTIYYGIIPNALLFLVPLYFMEIGDNIFYIRRETNSHVMGSFPYFLILAGFTGAIAYGYFLFKIAMLYLFLEGSELYSEFFFTMLYIYHILLTISFSAYHNYLFVGTDKDVSFDVRMELLNDARALKYLSLLLILEIILPIRFIVILIVYGLFGVYLKRNVNSFKKYAENLKLKSEFIDTLAGALAQRIYRELQNREGLPGSSESTGDPSAARSFSTTDTGYGNIDNTYKPDISGDLGRSTMSSAGAMKNKGSYFISDGLTGGTNLRVSPRAGRNSIFKTSGIQDVKDEATFGLGKSAKPEKVECPYCKNLLDYSPDLENCMYCGRYIKDKINQSSEEKEEDADDGLGGLKGWDAKTVRPARPIDSSKSLTTAGIRRGTTGKVSGSGKTVSGKMGSGKTIKPAGLTIRELVKCPYCGNLQVKKPGVNECQYCGLPLN